MRDGYSLEAVICEKDKDMYEKNTVLRLPATSEDLCQALKNLSVTPENIDRFHFRSVRQRGIDARELNRYLPQKLELSEIDELNYLAEKLGECDIGTKENLIMVFKFIRSNPDNPIFSGMEFESIGSIITLTDNMNKFIFYPGAYDYDTLGQKVLDETVQNYDYGSGSLEEVFMFVDRNALGQSIMNAQNGRFTPGGYIGLNDNEPIVYREITIPDKCKIWDEATAYMRPGALTYSYFEAKIADSIVDIYCSDSEAFRLAAKAAEYIGDHASVVDIAVQIATEQTGSLQKRLEKTLEKAVKANPGFRLHGTGRTKEEKEWARFPPEFSIDVFPDRLLRKQIDTEQFRNFNAQSRILIKDALERYPYAIRDDKQLCNMLLHKRMHEEILRAYSGLEGKDFLYNMTQEERQAFHMLSSDQQTLLKFKFDTFQKRRLVLTETAKKIGPMYEKRIAEHVSHLKVMRYDEREVKPSVTDQIRAFRESGKLRERPDHSRPQSGPEL